VNRMKPTKPPFRADHVGSFLRTAAIKQARARREKGELPADQLEAIENAEIAKIIRKQEACGLQLATDGEFRRSWWHFDFLCGLDGVAMKQIDHGIQFAGVQTKAERPDVVGKVGFSGHPMIAHFKFLKTNTRVTPKMTIPSPTLLHFRFGRQSIPTTLYPDLDQFFDDLGATYAKVVQAFYDAGCRYLQFDDTIWAFLCSEKERAQSRQRGDNPDELPEKYATMINQALAAKPADMAITTHICRGNFRSTWISEGGYEPIAEVLFGKLNYDGYFLEYDTDRAGGFEPLRFVPKGNKQIVLGLVSSKIGALENKDDIKRRIGEASKFVAPEQLCVSPQCGFASTEEGNVLSEDEQWAKLAFIVELANEVWT
jgi:5-methyltetrahydropteroyltriglutamate--homocysteine methyltransferase